MKEKEESKKPGTDPNVFCQTVGKRLLQLRNDHNLSQGQLAKLCSLTQNIISRMENGNASYDNFLVVCNFWLSKEYNLNYLLAEHNTIYHEKIQPGEIKEDIAIYFDRPE